MSVLLLNPPKKGRKKRKKTKKAKRSTRVNPFDLGNYWNPEVGLVRSNPEYWSPTQGMHMGAYWSPEAGMVANPPYYGQKDSPKYKSRAYKPVKRQYRRALKDFADRGMYPTSEGAKLLYQEMKTAYDNAVEAQQKNAAAIMADVYGKFYSKKKQPPLGKYDVGIDLPAMYIDTPNVLWNEQIIGSVGAFSKPRKSRKSKRKEALDKRKEKIKAKNKAGLLTTLRGTTATFANGPTYARTVAAIREMATESSYDKYLAKLGKKGNQFPTRQELIKGIESGDIKFDEASAAAPAAAKKSPKKKKSKRRSVPQGKKGRLHVKEKTNPVKKSKKRKPRAKLVLRKKGNPVLSPQVKAGFAATAGGFVSATGGKFVEKFAAKKILDMVQKKTTWDGQKKVSLYYLGKAGVDMVISGLLGYIGWKYASDAPVGTDERMQRGALVGGLVGGSGLWAAINLFNAMNERKKGWDSVYQAEHTSLADYVTDFSKLPQMNGYITSKSELPQMAQMNDYVTDFSKLPQMNDYVTDFSKLPQMGDYVTSWSEIPQMSGGEYLRKNRPGVSDYDMEYDMKRYSNPIEEMRRYSR